MALPLPDNFKQDIQSKDTALFPVVIIDTDTDGVDDIMISTNAVQLGDRYFKPLLLNIPSINESIDIEGRNYKISNVTLDISNYLYEGKRFSDLVPGSLINVEVNIYWASPSSKGDINFDDPDVNDVFLAYHGTIRRYDMGVEKVKLVVEDRSQSKMHKDLPITYLGDDATADEVPDKYKNKPVPMVYGHVDRSPCVFRIETFPDDPDSTVLKTIIVDSVPIKEFVETQETIPQINDLNVFGSLYIGDSDTGHAPCARIFGYALTSNVFPGFTFPIVDETNENYTYDTENSSITFNLDANNDLANGILRGIVSRTPYDAVRHLIAGSYAANDYPINTGASYWNIYNDPNSPIVGQYAGGDDGELVGNPPMPGWVGDSSIPMAISGSAPSSEANPNYPEADGIAKGVHLKGVIHNDGSDTVSVKVLLIPSNVEYAADTYFIGCYFGDAGSNFWTDYVYNDGFLGQSWEVPSVDVWIGYKLWSYNDFLDFLNLSSSEWWFNNLSSEITEGNNPYQSSQNPFEKRLDNISTPSSITDFNIGSPRFNAITGTAQDIYGVQVRLDIWEANIFHVTYVDKLTDRNFYADVVGRTDEYGDEIITAPQIIAHIMDIELGVTGLIVEEPPDYSDWRYDFTINKKINSKKLLEGIASASPFVPRFDNRGNFKLEVIRKDYTNEDVTDPTGINGENASENHIIKENDVIDFSFSRTRIEDVYTKIELKYNWDYGLDDFVSSYSVSANEITNFSGGSGYDYGYYGFPDNPDNPGTYDPITPEDPYNRDADSTLIIDDDRGKYIRKNDIDENGDGITAKNLALWLLSWHCNQHLTMKIKLPLKYLNLEVGDIIEFDEILGGVEPYRINYATTQTQSVLSGGQTTYNKFLITATNKNLDSVGISCIQMHVLSLSRDSGDAWYAEGSVEAVALIDEPFPWALNYNGGQYNTWSNIGSGCRLIVTPDDGHSASNYSFKIDEPGSGYTIGDILTISTQIQIGENDWRDQTAYLMVTHIIGAESIFGDPPINLIKDGHFAFNVGEWHPGDNNVGEWVLVDYPSYDSYSDENMYNTGLDFKTTWLQVGGDYAGQTFTPGADGDFIRAYSIHPLVVGTLYSIHINVISLSGSSLDIFLGDAFVGKISGTGLWSRDVSYEGGENEGIKIAKSNNAGELYTQINSVLVVHSQDDPEFQESTLGDINNDGVYNVLDVVALANCVIQQNCPSIEFPESADINCDGVYNVLDVVQLASCVLAQNCGDLVCE